MQIQINIELLHCVVMFFNLNHVIFKSVAVPCRISVVGGGQYGGKKKKKERCGKHARQKIMLINYP